MSTSNLIEQALAHHAAGRLQEAAATCEQILQSQPDHIVALHLLGAIACQQERYDQAVELIKRTITIGGARPDFCNTLGMAQMGQGQLEQAEASFRLAIKLNPDFWQGHNHLATVLHRNGRFQDALASHKRAVELAPGSARARCGMGRTLQSMNDPAKAAECFKQASELAPNSAEALLGLGVALHRLKRLDEAVDVLRKATILAPGDPLAYAELGDALQTQRCHKPAIDCYQQALRLNDKLVHAWFSLGCAQASLGDHADAAESFRQALTLAPDHFPAHHNLGKVLFGLGQVDDGLEHFRRAAALDANPMPRSAMAISIPGSPKADQQMILDVRRDWTAQLTPGVSPTGIFQPSAEALQRPLRIGYVSGFFHKRNWMKPVWGLINQHDRCRYEIHLFSDAPESQISGGYRKHPSDHFHNTSKISNGDLADLIKKAGIDLLVDLNGYSMPERLPVFIRRPAPLIVGWFNMYATTGMTCFDYLIGDMHVIRPGEEVFYTERLVRIAGSYLTFEVSYAVPEVAPPPCLRNGYVTFGSLASLYKITPEVAAAWASILQACPESRLVLKNSALGSCSNRLFVQRLFAGLGITAERMELEGPAEHHEFLRKYDQIDLALDTFPYNGGTTTTEAIWQGVPVLTFSGDRWAARTSASLLRNCHLSSFVAENLQEYIERAIEWGRRPDSPARLADLRATMRDRLLASPVCDTFAFARSMEAAYTRMWEQWCLKS